MKKVILFLMFSLSHIISLCSQAQIILPPNGRQFDNSCYLPQMREFKKDLVVTGLSFENDIHGNIVAFLKIRNIGNVRFDGNVAKAISARLNGYDSDALLAMPLESGETKSAVLLLPEKTFRHCEEVTVTIDNDSRAGQLGCGVFSNDTATVLAYEKGKLPLCL